MFGRNGKNTDKSDLERGISQVFIIIIYSVNASNILLAAAYYFSNLHGVFAVYSDFRIISSNFEWSERDIAMHLDQVPLNPDR